MEPVAFEQATNILLKPDSLTDALCGPLPVWSNGQQCVSCWRPSWRERLSILIFGRVWLWVWSGRTQPPVRLDGKRTPFGS